jgi:hypothetical protein
MDEAALKIIVDQQLAEAKVKEIPLSQVADFTLLRQIFERAAILTVKQRSERHPICCYSLIAVY